MVGMSGMAQTRHRPGCASSGTGIRCGSVLSKAGPESQMTSPARNASCMHLRHPAGGCLLLSVRRRPLVHPALGRTDEADPDTHADVWASQRPL